jgi:hypothetical protein
MSFSSAKSELNGGNQQHGLLQLALALEQEAIQRRRESEQIIALLQQVLNQRG